MEIYRIYVVTYSSNRRMVRYQVYNVSMAYTERRCEIKIWSIQDIQSRYTVYGNDFYRSVGVK